MSHSSWNPKKIMMSLSRDDFKQWCIDNRENLRQYIESLTEEGYHTFESWWLTQWDMVSWNALINGLGEPNCKRPTSFNYDVFIHRPWLNGVVIRGGEYHFDEDGNKIYHDSAYYNITPEYPDPTIMTSGYLKCEWNEEDEKWELSWKDISGLTDAVTYEDGKLYYDFEHEILTLVRFYNKSQTDAKIEEYLLNYYTKEIIDQKLAKKVDKEIIDAGNKALIFNEADGGGAKFEHNDGTWSYVGVNDGGSTGIAGQLYVVDGTTKNGTRLNLTKNGFFYTKGTVISTNPDYEIATIGELAQKQDKLPNYVENKYLKVIDLDGTLVLTWADAGGSFDPTQYYTKLEINDLLNEKLDIVDIINDLTHTDTNKPLSANMGKELNDRITNLESMGKFLSTWDCSTGLPETNPPTLPYEYKTGDYFVISNVGTGTKYKPNGDEYDGNASTTVETETVNIGDFYIYDGTNWGLLSTSEAEVTWPRIVGNPMTNANLAALFNAKASQSDLDDLELTVTNHETKITTVEGQIVNINESISDLGDDKEDKSNKTTTLSSASTNTQYPGAKAVYDALTDKENLTNKVTELTASSTDEQYPSAKCVYDLVGDIESLLEELTTGGGAH